MATSPVGGIVVQKSQRERVQQRECVNIFRVCVCVRMCVYNICHICPYAFRINKHTQTHTHTHTHTNYISAFVCWRQKTSECFWDSKTEGWAADGDAGKWSPREKHESRLYGKRAGERRERTDGWIYVFTFWYSSLEARASSRCCFV